MRPECSVLFSKVVGMEGGDDLCVLVAEVSEAFDVMRVMIGHERGILGELRGWHAGEECAVAPAEYLIGHAGMVASFYMERVCVCNGPRGTRGGSVNKKEECLSAFYFIRQPRNLDSVLADLDRNLENGRDQRHRPIYCRPK